ncbi:unnamed protein product [Rangifer tarandus platyrhynchus]|uniref:Uncharacterized protein n=1 Tax=Rangifer tarandus platyrhynchus TaxID=3082113 RepID=A0AC59ZL75_RANTA
MSNPPSSYNEILLVLSTSLRFNDPTFTDLTLLPSLQPEDMSNPPSSYNEILLVLSTSLRFNDPNFTDLTLLNQGPLKHRNPDSATITLLKFLLPKSLVTSCSQINSLFLALVDAFNTID